MSIQQHQLVRSRHRADCKCQCDRQALADARRALHSRVRAALGRRDIATLFQLLQHYGFSQRRIADSLGVPRGWMGLAFETPGGTP